MNFLGYCFLLATQHHQQQERFLAIRRIHRHFVLFIFVVMISKSNSLISFSSRRGVAATAFHHDRFTTRKMTTTTTTTTTHLSGAFQANQRPGRFPRAGYPLFSFSAFSNPPNDDDNKNVLLLDPLIVCGPSGVGKGTIIDRFMNSNTGTLHQYFGFCVSHTTRSPRPGEVDGVHYHFVDINEMERLLSQQQQQPQDGPSAGSFFLESARVHGNYYGTSWQALRAVQEQGMKCLLDIDVQGVQRIKSIQQRQQAQQSIQSNNNNMMMMTATTMMRLAPKYIFIAPPSLEILQERLMARNTETEESLRRRLANAAAEVAYGTDETTTSSERSYYNNFDAVIVNNDLDQAVHDFEKAIRRLYDF